MLGERDSEMCVVLEDTIMEDGRMAGQPYRVGKFSHSLRCRLYRCVYIMPYIYLSILDRQRQGTALLERLLLNLSLQLYT